jgi:hypothetical protein
MMNQINNNVFKRRFLDFRKEYLNKSLTNYFDKNKKDDVDHPIKLYFPFINQKDITNFDIYIKKSKIEYSNRFKFKVDKNILDEYVETLVDDKIGVDIIRLSFTKNFIYHFNGKINKISNIRLIDTKIQPHFKENGIYFYNYEQIENKEQFLDNLLKTNIYYKYLLHQDIHNSIINPIINAIMLSNYYRYHPNSKNVIIQLKDITQIYKYTNNQRNKIEMTYFIEEYFIYDPIKSDTPIEKKIDPYLLIKIEMNIGKNSIEFAITY